MALPYAILGVLAPGPQQGYAVHRAVASLLAGLRAVNHGQVYATLARLSRDGLVHRDAAGSGATFALTAEGRRRLARWLERPVGWRTPDGALPARLALLAASGDRAGVARLVAAQRARCAALARVLERRPPGLAGEAAREHLRAELDWLLLVEQTLLDGAVPRLARGG